MLAEAVAASAAVPYVIGALPLKLPQSGWYATDPETLKPLRAVIPPLKQVHLWDGGAYENLGLEPLYKLDQGLAGCDFLICSDASGPLATEGRTSHLRSRVPPWPARQSPSIRYFSSDQIRALRSWMFVGGAEAPRGSRGCCCGWEIRHATLISKSGRASLPYEYDEALSEDDVATAAIVSDESLVPTLSGGIRRDRPSRL